MNQLAKEQKITGERIQTIVRNFNKDSEVRKTKPYYEKKIHELSSAWDTFEAADNKIRTIENVPIDHLYFRTEYYKEISELVQKYQEIFESQLAMHNDAEIKSTSKSMEKESSKPSQVPTMIRLQKAMMETIERHLISISKETSAQVRSMLTDMISRLWGQVEELHFSILELEDSPIYNIKSYIELESLVRTNTIKDAVSNQPQDIKTPVKANNSPVRLPKLTIPAFDGDYLKWSQFCDMFTQMVHNQAIPAIQKMWYLKTNLTGEAEKLIRHLALTESNYESAWSLIQGRYNNTRILTSALISKIMSTPAITTDNPTSATVKNLHDTTHEGLLALSNLGVDVSTWDPLLLHFVIKKLDRQSHILYEQSIAKPKENQSIRSFLEFLEFRFQSLEAIGHKERTNHARSLASTTPDKRKSSFIVCKQSIHPLFSCKQFLQMPASARLQCAQKNKLCVNCLRPGHKASVCTLRACTKCNKKHNSLLLLEGVTQKGIPNNGAKQINQHNEHPKPSALASSSNCERRGYILLGTVKIIVKAHNGQTIMCRALLDSGSQVNLVTERLVQRLGISSQKTNLQIEGISGVSRNTKRRINLGIQSRVTKYSTRLVAFVLPEIVSKQPAQFVDVSSWPIPATISLADPTFNQPEHIDMLSGAEFHHQLLKSGQIKLDEDLPILQDTVFGWMIVGRIDTIHLSGATCGVFTAEEEMTNELVKRFWKLDEVSENQPSLSVTEKRCESLFVENTRRLENGHFMVRLPFLDEPTNLGESKKTAFNRLCALEKRLAKDPAVNEQYKEFMKEYETLGHMSKIKASELPERHYVIPHHYVLKPESTSTKLRVIFDASSKTSYGRSLNDVLHNGPMVQPELFTILLRFRLPTYVFTADIQKMYRQILMHPEDRVFQVILWRDNPSQPAQYYNLNTVTYGTRAAPYLATKCLQKLAQEHSQTYPLGSTALSEHFYVDDGLVGSNSLIEAITMQQQLTELLGSAGFNLRKWCANHRQLLDHIPPEHQEVSMDLEGMETNSIKTLGLMWRPSDDQFMIKVNQQTSDKITKRSVTSELARIFDPLGILAPVVVTAKMFIQKLWQLKASWDDPLPPDHERTWRLFHYKLNSLQNITFPRHVFSQRTPKSIQIHVFADASEKAYGAAIYLRSILQDRKVIVKLLCAKSRMAPVKTQTLPRLELCAALLGVQLTSRVKKDLKFDNHPTFFWTDSEIVLAWINSSSSSFHTFVANRVARIQEGSFTSQWRHVRSADNPADLISRGIPARSFASANLWFYGPLFLHGRESLWSASFKKNINATSSNSLELKQKQPDATVAITSEPGDTIYQINHHKSFTTLHRIIAYMLRFSRHTRQPNTARAEDLSLKPKEWQEALIAIVKTIQANDFQDELNTLRKHKMVKKGSRLFDLTPFLDKDDVLRATSRIGRSSGSYNSKHPMLLPYNDPLVKLLMKSIHERYFHCSPLTLLNQTQQIFWPIKGKIMARAIVHHCITCSRARPTLMNQIMGNLPETRIQPTRPFVNTGVDFCGPFWVHYKTRGKQPQKAYMMVFCCFATKAVHLELATDLSTDAFIGSLLRFIGRRGHCAKLYCDNATNFVGARNKLTKLEPAIYSQPARESINKVSVARGIEFNFIPPRSPHFGGLWEAAVNSAKNLLVRSVASASLTYEELETVVVGVEAVLNSRPISPMSTDPRDLEALTPGHFLIGEPLTAQTDTNAEPNTSSMLRRWELVKRIRIEFWRRCSRDYLNQLQTKRKWRDQSINIQPGMMLIIKEDNCPVRNWPLGRITKVFKGDDGMVRVVEVKTASGIRTRSIHRLAPLPVEDYFNPKQTASVSLEDSSNKIKALTSNLSSLQQTTKDVPGPSHQQYEDLSSSSDDHSHTHVPSKLNCKDIPGPANQQYEDLSSSSNDHSDTHVSSKRNCKAITRPANQRYKDLFGSSDESTNQDTPTKRPKMTIAPGMLSILIT